MCLSLAYEVFELTKEAELYFLCADKIDRKARHMFLSTIQVFIASSHIEWVLGFVRVFGKRRFELPSVLCSYEI